MGMLFSDTIFQRDRIFIRRDASYTDIHPGMIFLRIREAGKKIFLTIKQRGENDLERIEKEIMVSDIHQCSEILVLLGYKEVLLIEKARTKATFGEYEICLDKVNNLGTFIEIEKETNENPEIVQEELGALLRAFGIEGDAVVKEGYDTLLMRRADLTAQ